jgi:hypothetical protein
MNHCNLEIRNARAAGIGTLSRIKIYAEKHGKAKENKFENEEETHDQ